MSLLSSLWSKFPFVGATPICVRCFFRTDISYHMTIKTGDKPNAGTDANVYFALHGDKGETPRIGLQDERQTFRRFERARADKFVVQTADVGKVCHAIIITKPPSPAVRYICL